MNYKLLGSLTASLLIATSGLPAISSATTSEPSDQMDTIPNQEPPSNASLNTESEVLKSDPNQPAPSENSTGNVVKVGEQQSSLASTQPPKDVVAKVQPHQISGREAATLYVRNIPILTFLGVAKQIPDGVKIGTQARSISESSITQGKSLSDPGVTSSSLASLVKSAQPLSTSASDEINLEMLDEPTAQADPVWRASVIAARINQLYRDGVDADRITVSREQPKNLTNSTVQPERFVIRADQLEIATIDAKTILPDATRNLEKDALQATNRLRRVLGAAPLREVSIEPNPNIGDPITIGPIRMQFTGWASWYGPGFHGNRSASGEPFNQHAMTAAHRTLPFGTQVLVTNLGNGQSVVVRINDRGPFHGDRIIDLSAGAARVLGLIQLGVARVRIDVIDSRSAAVGN